MEFERYLEIIEDPAVDEDVEIIIIRARDDPYCSLPIRSKVEFGEFLHLLNSLAEKLGWSESDVGEF